jgi:glycosyltransferase involved in cell wall biosynthesis
VAFAKELEKWSGARVMAIHHGFDKETFTRDSGRLAPLVEEKLDAAHGCLKLLFVSHFNYYRNFETLIRALPILRERLVGRPARLFLTCHMEPGKNPGAYRPEATRDLVKNLGVSDMVMELGAIPYHNLHRLYASADVYISPAYTETFAHPLVEAMASGVPVVASDIAVHREICGDAAVYFERFSPDALAAGVMQIAEPSEMRRQMVADGLERVGDFSWKTHVEQILELSRELLRSKGLRPETEP